MNEVSLFFVHALETSCSARAYFGPAGAGRIQMGGGTGTRVEGATELCESRTTLRNEGIAAAGALGTNESNIPSLGASWPGSATAN